jgi:calcineurin-like phosphoesterase family protein
MTNAWVTSDTHFNDVNILRYRCTETDNPTRPEFANTQDMDEHIINCWNSVVKTGDTVYHLGDVVMGKDKLDWMNNNWSRLRGSKILIVGNHDNIKFLTSFNWFDKVLYWENLISYGLLLTHALPVHPELLEKIVIKAKICLNIHGHLHTNRSPGRLY